MPSEGGNSFKWLCNRSCSNKTHTVVQQQLQTRHSVVNMHVVLSLRTCTLEPVHISNSQFRQLHVAIIFTCCNFFACSTFLHVASKMQILHVNMHFSPNIYVKLKLHVNMQKIACQHAFFFPTCMSKKNRMSPKVQAIKETS